MSRYQGIPDKLTKGRCPIDPTRTTVKVGSNLGETIRDIAHVYVRNIQYNLATELVKDINNGNYPDVCRWMERNKDKLTGNGIALWMGMIDRINGSVNNAQPVAIAPMQHGRFQVSAPPSAHPPEVYDLAHVQVVSISGHHHASVVNAYCPNIVYFKGDLTVCDDLAYLINRGQWQKIVDLLDKQNRKGIVNAGKRLYNEMKDEIARGVNRNFQPQFAAPPTGRIPADDEVVEEMEAILDTMDTYGIGQPNRKSTKEWEPDTPDPDVDLMKSIRDACAR